MTPRRWLIASAIVVAALLLAGRVVADLYSSYAWYDALGATAVWRARVGTITTLRIAAWVAASLYALGHLFTVRQSVVSLVVQRQLGDLEIPESVHGRYLTASVVALSLVMGGLLALSQDDWTTAFLAGNGGAFGEYDIYFGADLGFFVFWLPFEVQTFHWALIVVLVTTAVVIALYVLTAGIRIEDGALRMSAHARRHLTVIVGILLLMLSWNFRLEMYQLLLRGTGPGGAFGYLDHHVSQHGALILSLATLAAGVVVMVAGVNSQRIAITATASVLLLWVAARQLAPAVATRSAGRDPVVREREYLATQAGYSRRGFGVDGIVVDDSAALYRGLDSALSGMALWDDAMIRLAIDPRARLDTTSAWVGWRAAPGGPVADVVRRDGEPNAVRELWTVTSVDAAMADAAGDIVPIIDPHGRSPGGERVLRTPLVYPGARSHQVVGDSAQRVIGVAMDTRIARIAHAWSLQSPQFLAGTDVAQRRMLVDVRDVRERIRHLTPFFVQGSFVTPMVLGDTVYWAVDLYSASNWYPLSMPIRAVGAEWRYFQHAAVAVVDGSSGDVLIIPDETLDPLARVWIQRFHSLFTTAAALPAGVREMLPPASDQLRAQAMVFGRFGMTTSEPELRHIADGTDSARFSPPAMFLGRDRRTMLTVQPMLDSSDRYRGMMVTTGGERRRTAWYESAAPGPRWPALEESLRSLDSTNARRLSPHYAAVRPLHVGQRTLFAQPVFVVPLEDGPTFSHVGLVAGDTTRKVTLIRRGGTAMAGDLRAQVQAIYAEMRAALQRNDWIAFGRAMDALSRAAGSPLGRRP